MLRRKVTKKSDERERVNKREMRLRRNIRDGWEGGREEIEQRERNNRKNEIKITREKVQQRKREKRNKKQTRIRDSKKKVIINKDKQSREGKKQLIGYEKQRWETENDK